MDDDTPTPCNYCGDPLGATPFRDVVLVNVTKGMPFPPDRGMPQHVHLLFCNEGHFRAWFAESAALPFETSDDGDRSLTNVSTGYAEGRGFRYVGFIAATAVVALAVVGAISLVRLVL